jgi:hypothetical protein
MKLADLFIGKRLFVGCGKPAALGKGEEEIRGSAYAEGPVQIGTDSDFSSVDATLMVGDEYNTDSETHPTTSVHVKGDVQIDGDDNIGGSSLKITGDTDQTGSTNQTGDITLGGTLSAGGEVFSNDKGHRLSNKKNLPFDMEHPNKKGWRLRHVCIEGPEIAVYCRGRVKNSKEIELPSYWDGLVKVDSITVQLTPVGAHQNVIVKRWDNKKIYLQSQGGMPIDCFYHIIAKRVDDDLIVEYKGESHLDYPGGNEGYSFSWENDNMERLVKEVAREKLDGLTKGL